MHANVRPVRSDAELDAMRLQMVGLPSSGQSDVFGDWPLASKQDKLMRGDHENDYGCQGLNQ
jgi:hypothetical protein